MILVTGATGLVGSHLLLQLVQEEQPIRALYRTDAKKKYVQQLFTALLPNSPTAFDRIEWVQATVNDIPALTSAFDKVTHVYHCAAMISFEPYEHKLIRKTNIEGTANIVNLCLTHHVEKLCHVSSISAIDEAIEKKVIDETNEWNPETTHSVYAISKYGAEMEVWRGTQEGLNAVIVNPGIIIGSGFFESGSGFMFKKMYQGMRFYTTGSSGYVGIKDVIQIMTALMSSTIVNERFIVVSENMSYQQSLSKIARQLGKKAPSYKITPMAMKTVYYLQWFRYQLFGTKRTIVRASIKSAFSTHSYENQKVRKALNYDFMPIDQAIAETASFFLQQHS